MNTTKLIFEQLPELSPVHAIKSSNIKINC
jgi:hypothetical protein